MKTFSLKTQEVVPVPLEEVFAFFSNPENLRELTPVNLGFSILTPGNIVMACGAVIDYRIRVGGFPVRWRTVISEYDPPRRFVDVQGRGPYSYWKHTHTFTALPEGTLIEDDVEYALPLGIFGQIVRHLFVRRQLEKIFSFRSQTIHRLFSGKVVSSRTKIPAGSEA
ncbi:MAG TPA: SRPBCC family protein [Bacteroidota bacterium]|jgi:ligand-binding SRPBCC domain-containing protein|nr:SRPBCC family protein [Bacteroidota bacterium]